MNRSTRQRYRTVFLAKSVFPFELTGPRGLERLIMLYEAMHYGINEIAHFGYTS